MYINYTYRLYITKICNNFGKNGSMSDNVLGQKNVKFLFSLSTHIIKLYLVLKLIT